MVITDNNISTSVFNEIRTVLVAASLHTTNSTTSVETTASVLAAYNDQASNKTQVVIVPITKAEDTFFFSSTEGKKTINVMIECYANNTLGIDQLSDQVETALKVNSIVGINLEDINTDYTLTMENDQKFYRKTVIAVYGRV